MNSVQQEKDEIYDIPYQKTNTISPIIVGFELTEEAFWLPVGHWLTKYMSQFFYDTMPIIASI